MEVRDFLKVNKLKQVDLARYLGVTEAAISNVVKGKSCFSNENLIKITENPFGWDTSMLVDSPEPILESAAPATNLSNVEILLRDMLAEKEAKIDTLQEIIWELKEENGRLKEQLRAKGGDAGDAVNSSSAVA
jgi:transcriptional regulator with XRE-family HTH domain